MSVNGPRSSQTRSDSGPGSPQYSALTERGRYSAPAIFCPGGSLEPPRQSRCFGLPSKDRERRTRECPMAVPDIAHHQRARPDPARARAGSGWQAVFCSRLASHLNARREHKRTRPLVSMWASTIWKCLKPAKLSTSGPWFLVWIIRTNAASFTDRGGRA